MHISVGVIIKNNQGKILMIDRTFFPMGWACPAGHVDEGESPEHALIREFKEETNLDIKKYKLLIHEYVDWNKCIKGAKGHDWYVYEITDWSGEIIQNKLEENAIKWVTKEEIKKEELEKIWQQRVKKLKIL